MTPVFINFLCHGAQAKFNVLAPLAHRNQLGRFKRNEIDSAECFLHANQEGGCILSVIVRLVNEIYCS